mgnify:CR=1 FL=1
MNWSTVIKFSLKHWRELLVAASLLAVIIKTQLDYRALNKAYEISQQSLQEQVEGLQKIHEEELRKRDVALKTYRATLDEIERGYIESREEVERLKKQKRDRLERNYSSNPEDLANEIVNTYGFEHASE